MRNKISSKIITGTALAVFIPLVLMGVFEYYFFTDILKENAVNDAEIRLNQTEQEFSNIQNDIKTYSINILIDSQIQDILKIVAFENNYDYLHTVFEINRRLRQLSSMRNYVHSIVVVAENGSVYGSLASYNNKYMADSLSEEWYQKFLKKDSNYYFTSHHNIEITGVQADVISYISNIKDLENSKNILGRLIININYDYLDKIFASNGKNSDSFWCFSEDNSLIYKNNKNQIGIEVPEHMLGVNAPSEAYFSNDNGYYILKSSELSKWKFVSFSSYDRLYSKISNFIYIFLLIILISFILILAINIPIVHNIIKPLKKLTKAMDIVSTGNLNVKIDISSHDEIEHLYKGFNNMLSQINCFLESKVEFEEEKNQMKFQLLLAQMNPHFIYNVLNTIIYMARKEKNKNIVDITESFINILQKNLTLDSNKLFYTVKKEVSFTKSYLNIQRYRYRDKFVVKWNIKEALNNYYIPKTIIQPLVENALYHGIYPKEKLGEIIVTVDEVNNNLIITIEDDGVGISDSEIKDLLERNDKIVKDGRLHIGITSIRDRINFLYGEGFGINIKSKLGKGTKITIMIPKKTNEYSLRHNKK